MNIKELKLDETNYTIVEMKNVFSRIVLELKIAKLGSSFTSYLDDSMELEIAFLKVLANLDAEGTAKLLKSLIQNSVEIPGNMHDDKIFDKHFSQNYEHLVPLAFECFDINFGKSIVELKKKFTAIGILSPKSGDLQFKKEDTTK